MAWADDRVIDRLIDVEGSAATTVMLRAGSCYIELFQYSAPQSDLDRPLRPFDRGYTHFCVEVTDMARDIEHLKACGMTFNGREFGDFKTFYGYDPEGNIIEVLEIEPGDPRALSELAPPRA